MAWNIIRNSEPTFHEDRFSGKCPKFEKNATVTVLSGGSECCKTDLQKTYQEKGRKCSLLEGTDEAMFSPCMEKCCLVPEKFL